MADKRISQLVERVTLLNNDVFPIVASGATTTNKVTLQTIDDYMQTNLDFGVTSVAMTVPTGLSVTGTPITSTGTFVVTFTAGYSIPTNAKQTQWDTAYSNRIVSVTAPITFASNVLGITQSGAASDGYLSSTDWNTFNSKQNALTFGNLTEATSSVLTITSGTGAVIGSGTSIEVKQASGTQDGFLDSADWSTFNGKQNALTGTGIVKSTGGTITYLTDNTSNWDSAYNNKINSAAVTGTTTKTLTLTQQDGGTITTTWSDLVNTGTVTSVGVSMPSAFSVANSPITSSGTIAITGAGTISQYIDGTGALQTFPTIIAETTRLVREVYNNSGTTMTKGTVVYINGGQGNLPTIARALATGDATSAQTYGVVQASIGNMSNGYIVVVGDLIDMDTQAFVEGTQLYLSPTTAGEYTSTKPYAPQHLVYVGIVTRSHPTQGIIAIKIQNGFEMDELHNVSAQNPNNNDILQYKTATNLWTKVAGSTTNIAEGTNLYYTDARARAAFSESVTGLDYNSTTGVLSTTTGYGIPTAASQTNWDAAYNDKINSAAVTGTTTKTLTLTQQDGGTITASWTDINTDAVTSVFGRTGAVVATSGDYNTDQVTEGTSNLYFTNTRSRSSISLTTTGTSGAATYNSTTGVLNIPSYVGGVTSVNTLTGAVVLTTSNIAEGTNLYYTDTRARAAISLTTTGTSGAATYSGGVLNIPNYGSALSGYLPLSGGTLTGPLGLNGSQFYEQATPSFALNANNSDLIGLNGLYFNDYAEAPSEGLNWYHTATTFDSLWSAGGNLYYTPNRTTGTSGTSYVVYHTGNLPSYLTGTGSDTRIAYWTGSGTLSGEDDFAYDYSNNRLRINSGTWSSSAATKLLVGGLLTDGSDATAQINGFIRMRHSLIIHLNSDITKSASLTTIENGKIYLDDTLLINTNTDVSGYRLIVNGQSWLNNFGIGMRNTYTTSTDYPQLFLTDGAAGGIRPSEYGHVFIQSRSSASRGIGFITGSTPTERLFIKGTGEIGIGTTDPNYSMLQIVGDWVSGFSTLRISGLNGNQTGIGLYNTAGARKSVFAYTGSYTYLETDGNNLAISPNGVFRGTFYSNGNIGLGGGTTGVSQEDIFLNPTSGAPALYIGRLSSTNDDNTNVYFQNRVGTSVMLVDTGNTKVGIGTLNPTALYGYGLEIFDNTGGGTLTLSRDAGNQRGVIRMGRNNGGSYQGAIQIIGDSTAGTGAGGNLFMQTTDSAGTFAYRISMLSSGRVVVGNSTTANGILQVTGEHVSGYGMLNMNSTNSCIIAMDSSAATPDTYLRMKHAGTDRWYVGMNGAVSTYNYNIAYQGNGNPNLTASSSGDVFMPYRLQIASTGGFSSSSAKLLVGSIISAGSSAIMQVNGFIRMLDQLIIHQNNNTANEVSLQCTGATTLTINGTLIATGDVTAYSDARVKRNIATIENALEKTMSLRGVSYFRTDTEKDKKKIGVIAQEIREVLPEVVFEDDKGNLSVSYGNMVGLLIEAVKEQQKQINELKNQVA